MSEIFLSGDSQEFYIGEMSSRRAQLFVALTKAAASIYKVEDVVIERVENAYFIRAEPFCSLVDQVFEWPINLLYTWSHYAAGFYENIKDETRIWEWRAGNGEREQYNSIVSIEPIKWTKELRQN